MKSFLNSRGQTIATLIAAASGFVLATEITAFAQRDTRPSPVERRVQELKRQSEQYERDKLNRDLGGESDKSDRRRAQALAAQIKKDLEGLQAGYNQIVIAMAAKKTLPNDQILDAVAEIKECSTRLKDNLALPRPIDDKSQAPTPGAASEQTEAPLLTLQKHIYNFVMNPLFEAPAVLDVEQGKKASRDLDRIIEVSDSITKAQNRTRKTAS